MLRPSYNYSTLDLNIANDVESESTSATGVTTTVTRKTFSPKPNHSGSAGLSLVWDGFSVGGGTQVGKPKDPDIYGETKYFDFQIHSVGWHLGWDLYTQQYQGFYEDSDATSATATKLNPEVYPDLKLTKLGLGVYYIFLPQYFSLPAAFNQTRVLDSRGISPLVMANAENIRFSGIPDSVKERLDLSDDLTNWENVYALGLQGGLGFTVKATDLSKQANGPFWNHSYYTLVLLGGRQYLYLSKVDSNDQSTDNETKATSDSTVIGNKLNIRFAFNFDVKLIFLGLSLIVDHTDYPTNNYDMSVESFAAEAFTGIRF